jgi:hypothetical protein
MLLLFIKGSNIVGFRKRFWMKPARLHKYFF